jgi:hypothetical protein
LSAAVLPRAPKPSGGIEGFPEREKNGSIRPNPGPADQQIGEFVRFCPHFCSLPTAAVASASPSLNLCDIRPGDFDSCSVTPGFKCSGNSEFFNVIQHVEFAFSGIFGLQSSYATGFIPVVYWPLHYITTHLKLESE